MSLVLLPMIFFIASYVFRDDCTVQLSLFCQPTAVWRVKFTLRAHFTYRGWTTSPFYRYCRPSCANQFLLEPGLSRSCVTRDFQLFGIARRRHVLSASGSWTESGCLLAPGVNLRFRVPLRWIWPRKPFCARVLSLSSDR